MSLKREREADSPEELFESTSITDRASRFIAVYSPSTPPKVLQSHPPYKSADHRILAWRKESRQQTLKSAKPIYDTGSDDDGEKYAGKKLEKLLIEMNVVGSVVVARWYGGVLLGPVRFDHIVNVAKEAIEKYRGSLHEAKKPKVETLTPEQEAEQKQKLLTVLAARDSSITVLRQLLAEKRQDTKSSQSEARPAPKSPDYSKMPLITLKRLEVAKDHTIAWILKQIDEAEALDNDVPRAKTDK